MPLLFFTQGQDIRHSLLLLVVGHDVVLKRVDIFMTRQLDYYGGGNTRREQVLTCHTPKGMVCQFCFDTSISGHLWNNVLSFVFSHRLRHVPERVIC